MRKKSRPASIERQILARHILNDLRRALLSVEVVCGDPVACLSRAVKSETGNTLIAHIFDLKHCTKRVWYASFSNYREPTRRLMQNSRTLLTICTTRLFQGWFTCRSEPSQLRVGASGLVVAANVTVGVGD